MNNATQTKSGRSVKESRKRAHNAWLRGQIKLAQQDVCNGDESARARLTRLEMDLDEAAK